MSPVDVISLDSLEVAFVKAHSAPAGRLATPPPQPVFQSFTPPGAESAHAGGIFPHSSVPDPYASVGLTTIPQFPPQSSPLPAYPPLTAFPVEPTAPTMIAAPAVFPIQQQEVAPAPVPQPVIVPPFQAAPVMPVIVPPPSAVVQPSVKAVVVSSVVVAPPITQQPKGG